MDRVDVINETDNLKTDYGCLKLSQVNRDKDNYYKLVMTDRIMIIHIKQSAASFWIPQMPQPIARCYKMPRNRHHSNSELNNRAYNRDIHGFMRTNSSRDTTYNS